MANKTKSKIPVKTLLVTISVLAFAGFFVFLYQDEIRGSVFTIPIIEPSPVDPMEPIQPDPVPPPVPDPIPPPDEKIEKLFPEKFGIEAKIVLVDSSGVESERITTLPFILQTLLGTGGEILDLGEIQATFIGITDQEAKVDVVAKAIVLMNNQTIDTLELRQIGSTINNRIILDILSREGYVFDFPDNPLVLRDNVQVGRNIFEIKIIESSAIVGEGLDTKRFTHEGEFTVYRLEFDLDQEKRIVLDDQGNVIEVFPDSSTFRVTQYCDSIGGGLFCAYPPHIIKFKDVNGNVIVEYEILNSKGSLTSQSLIGKIDGIEFAREPITFNGKNTLGTVFGTGKHTPIVGIPRNQTLVIELIGDPNFQIENAEVTFESPEDEMSYEITCSRGRYSGGFWAGKCTSNFGYSDASINARAVI